MNTLRNELKAKYSQIPNELIIDLSLSHGSLRVLLYLFTKPDDWNVYNKDICTQLGISEQTLTKYWKELLNSRWLRREKKRDDKGHLGGGYSYLIGTFSVSIQSTEQVKSIDYSNNKPLYKKETNITFTEVHKKFSFIDEISFDKLVTHLKTKYTAISKVRISNNIKKLINSPDLFSLAVDEMIRLDYNGLFVPSRNNNVQANLEDIKKTNLSKNSKLGGYN